MRRETQKKKKNPITSDKADLPKRIGLSINCGCPLFFHLDIYVERSYFLEFFYQI